MGIYDFALDVKIKNLLKNNPNGLTRIQIANLIGAKRTTVLDHLSKGKISNLRFRETRLMNRGRARKLYFLSDGK